MNTVKKTFELIASNLIWHAGDPQEYRDYFYSIMPPDVYESGYPMKKPFYKPPQGYRL